LGGNFLEMEQVLFFNVAMFGLVVVHKYTIFRLPLLCPETNVVP
jgi:hypothetical protein